MSTSSDLSALLGIQADLSFNTLQLSRISKKYEAIHKQLDKMTNYEEKWEKAFEDAQDVDKTCKIGNKTWKEKDQVLNDKMADAYAHAKVKEFDEDILIDLTEKDMEYDAIKTMLEASITELQAEKESWKQQTATDAQDTHLLQS